MVRDFNIPGEVLVSVKGGAHYSGFAIAVTSELGLADEPIRVSPRFYHKDVRVDDFGPDVPAEVLWMLGEVHVHMNLIHYDEAVLDICVSEGMAGSTPLGGLMGAGTPMGGGNPVLSSGNHFIHLNLASPVLGKPWRFQAAFLADQPVVYPLGTKATCAALHWRCLPYTNIFGGAVLGGGPPLTFELTSSGTALWDRIADVG